MPYVVGDIYPPLQIGVAWPLRALGLFVGVVGGYYLVRRIRMQLALRGQRKLAELSKPHKNDIINKALAEINRIQQAVFADTLTTDAGAAQISLTVRTAFDALMNHRTVYSARYEVAARHLHEMEQLLTLDYPVAFQSEQNKQLFTYVCTSAVRVVEACR